MAEREREKGMGACVSTPDGCVGGRLGSKKKKKTRKRRREGLNRRESSPARTAPVSEGSPEKYDRSVPPDRSSFNNPTFQGSFFLSLEWTVAENFST